MKFRNALIAVLVVSSMMAGAAFGGIGFRGVGAGIGYVDPEGGLGGTFGLDALADLGYLIENLGFEAHVTYWSKGEEEFGVDWSFKSFSFNALAKYYFAPEDNSLRPFGGGGLGISFNSVDAGPVDDSSTDINIVLTGGVKNIFSDTIAGIAEFRYVISGDFDYWGIFACFLYMLGQ